MKVIPVGHRVLVIPDPVEEVSKGGLILPKTERDKYEIVTGTVADVGETAFTDFGGTPWAIIGDRVIFQKYGGFVYTDEDTDVTYRVLNDEDIIARLDREKTNG